MAAGKARFWRVEDGLLSTFAMPPSKVPQHLLTSGNYSYFCSGLLTPKSVLFAGFCDIHPNDTIPTPGTIRK